MNKFVVSVALMVAVCTAPAPSPGPPPLAGAKIGGPFTLIDQDERRVTDQSYSGQWRVMYFGYTFCPDICPTDVANLARGMKRFAEKDAARAARTRLIMVSVDPGRDTPAQMKAFTAQFLPNMIGLTGDAKAIESTARSYGIAYSIEPGQTKDAYLVDHSRVTYLMSPDNKPVALVPHDGSAEAIAAELDKWIS
jgi:protein SCO1